MQNHQSRDHGQEIAFHASKHEATQPRVIENFESAVRLDESVEYNRARFYAGRMAHLLPPGRLLDINAASGIRMQAFYHAGWQAEGLEQDPELAHQMKSKLPAVPHNVSLSEFETPRRFDLVVATNIVDNGDTARSLALKAASLVARDGYLLIEHNRTAINLRDNISCRQQLAQTDRLFNELGYARVEWGRTPREARSELLKAALKNPQNKGSVSRLLSLPLQLLPDGLEFRMPDFGCLYSVYQKAQSETD